MEQFDQLNQTDKEKKNHIKVLNLSDQTSWKQQNKLTKIITNYEQNKQTPATVIMLWKVNMIIIYLIN